MVGVVGTAALMNAQSALAEQPALPSVGPPT